MKFIINENQFDKFVEVMLNREMPSKFDWWKGIKVIEFKRMNMRPKLIKLEGVLTVDSEWAAKQWPRFNRDKEPSFGDIEHPTLLSEIVSVGEADDVRDAISDILTYTLGEETFTPSLNHIEIKLQYSDDTDN
jgi:hypothetical protein